MPAEEPQIEIIGPDGIPIGVVRRRPPRPRRLWLHAALLGATFVTTTLVGGLGFAEIEDPTAVESFLSLLFHPAVIVAGLWFSIPLLAILLTHEMGHYLACRRHRLDATLPFFIPFPLGIGTLGAFIRIRSAIADKRELFDVGASGPLAGFVVTIPVLLAGIALSTPGAEDIASGGIILGEPLVFRLLAHLLHPGLPEGMTLFIHPLGFAGWVGLLATALNLLPFGQLDGGHITYALFGRLHRLAAWPLLAVLVVLGFWWMGWWLWAVIALVMGVRHPRVPDEQVPLDSRRRLLGWLCIAVFVLCFMPEPIRLVP